MHFQPESYILYDRLIENMILFESINPDKVYLLGYSAGGDGVYQIAPRMADRWAAVNMSAGHPNSVDLRNLACLPIALQGRLSVIRRDHYQETCVRTQNVSRSYEHSSLDPLLASLMCYSFSPSPNCGCRADHFVRLDVHKWLTLGISTTTACNTNAVRWLSQFVRNARPERVVWDLKTRVDRQAKGFWDGGGRGQQRSGLT